MVCRITSYNVCYTKLLRHTFLKVGESGYYQFNYFNQGSTDNYMDYKNKAKHTYHAQWKVMHNSKFTLKQD